MNIYTCIKKSLLLSAKRDPLRMEKALSDICGRMQTDILEK